MSSPGIRPRKDQSAAASGSKRVSPQKLRVLSADGAARAAPSIAMPRAKTELTELLAGDKLLCVRRRTPATATRQNTEACSGPPAADARSHAESPVANSGQSPAASPPTPIPGEDLARVIEAWPGLPRHVRAAILAMIRETAAGNA